MHSTRHKYDFAGDLRRFAADLDEIEQRMRDEDEGPNSPIVTLVQAMRQRADDIMRAEEQAERGKVNAATVFARFGPVKVRVERARVSGTLGLHKAA